jgi:hypothetical protein
MQNSVEMVDVQNSALFQASGLLSDFTQLLRWVLGLEASG